ncbi:Protein NipSnap [Armadillidium nasatum]|uniref:Protein NipSnap n=1 Tax=Armadillidium nasatum TaxID=96803 RepID=A0A5N5TAQ3_9CRUS|nr:Protein NipSnap [Armadillidium nasatum]
MVHEYSKPTSDEEKLKCSFIKQICFSTSSSRCKDSWLDKLLVRKIEPTKESHSRMLSDKEIIYELQTHNLKPGSTRPYLKNYENYANEIKNKKVPAELCGSWSVGVGDQDQCLHLWRYEGGYTTIDNVRHRVIEDSPGTMIEWGNNWARAIQFRQSNNEAYGGFFSQVGRLYNVHHVWCYESLEARKVSREDAWRHPGWNEVVAYTVPLIREQHTRIMVPNSFSQAQ